ncbi:MAG: thymidylate synthase [Archaeoglobaceae archaeon]
MIIGKDFETVKAQINGKILENGFLCKSRFGNYLLTEPSLLIVENPEKSQLTSDIYLEKYQKFFETAFDVAVKKLRERRYSRRVSIPLWSPEEHYSQNPVAITEISLLFDEKIHLTAYIRSLDCLNYFENDFYFLSDVLEKIAYKTELEEGSIAMLVAIPHVYERDLKRAEKLAESCKELYGYNELGTHLVEDYISSAWHSSLEIVYNHGKLKPTEWEMFEGQKRSKFVQRLFVEVQKPEENKIHDKAPFTEKYCIEYAHNYVIFAEKLLERVDRSILKEGEEYTYAERARFCEKDKVKVDQLYEAIMKLRSGNCRRDCYVAISRPWDLESSDPPCLRGYQFVKNADKLTGIFYMRSNDLYGAMHANMFAFALLTKYVAEITGFSNYNYCHFAVDAHVYEGFLNAVKEILYPEMKRIQPK